MKVSFPDEALAWLFLWWLSLPPDRESGLLNANNNRYELETLQRHAIQNIRETKDIDRSRASQHTRGHPPRRWTAHQAQHDDDDEDDTFIDEESLEDADETDVPQEVLFEEREAEGEVYQLERSLARAKDRQREVKSARGFFQKGGSPSKGKGKGKGKDPDMIARLKERTHCADCGQMGHWRGDKECKGKKATSSTQQVGLESDEEAHGSHVVQAEAVAKRPLRSPSRRGRLGPPSLPPLFGVATATKRRTAATSCRPRPSPRRHSTSMPSR